jgi:hypothetical protein
LKKKISVVGILLLLLLGLALTSCKQKQEVENESDVRKKWITIQENTIDRTYLPELKIVLTKETFTKKYSEKENKIMEYRDAQPLVSQKYTIYEESKKLLTDSKNGGGDTVVDVDSYYLNVYETKEDFPFVKKIDIKKVIQAYNPDYLPYMNSPSIGRMNGEECVSFNIYSKKAKTWGYASVAISLEDERVIVEYKKDEYSRDLKAQAENEKPIQFNIVNSTVTNLSEKLQANYTNTTQLNYLDEVDIKNQLTKKSPKLSLYFKVTDDETMYVRMSDTNVSVETIIQALLPEGENMYENLILYGNFSKDGQNHEIHSMDEFLEWYQEKK